MFQSLSLSVPPDSVNPTLNTPTLDTSKRKHTTPPTFCRAWRVKTQDRLPEAARGTTHCDAALWGTRMDRSETCDRFLEAISFDQRVGRERRGGVAGALQRARQCPCARRWRFVAQLRTP